MKAQSWSLWLALGAALGACATGGPTTRAPANSDLGALSTTAQALRDPSKLTEAVRESMYPLTQARVVIADYPLLKRDFPELEGFNEAEIDSWLLARTAYISKPQAAQTIVNTPIPHDPTREVSALRPSEYGRASVAVDSNNNLIDIKGTGSLAPHQGSHGNGLVSLGEGMREFIYENLVRDALSDAQSPIKTVGSYAVIDGGFDVVHADGSRSRAGLYLRQASQRHNMGFANGRDVDALKKNLEELGIETEGNIQMTRDRALIDFGHYVVSPQLQRQHREAGKAAKLLPLNVWGHDAKTQIPRGRWSLSRWDYPWQWSHEFAEAWGRGEADRAVAWQHFMVFKGSYAHLLKPRLLPSQSCTEAARSVLGAL